MYWLADCLIGILIMVYEIIPIFLGSVIHDITETTKGHFFHCYIVSPKNDRFSPCFLLRPGSPFEQRFLSKLTLQKKKVVPALSSQEHTLDYSKQIQKRKKRSCNSWGHDPATASRQRNSKNQSTKCAVLPKSHMSSFISEMAKQTINFKSFWVDFKHLGSEKIDTVDLQLFLFNTSPILLQYAKKATTLKEQKKSLLKLQNQGVYVALFFQMFILFFPRRDL